MTIKCSYHPYYVFAVIGLSRELTQVFVKTLYTFIWNLIEKFSSSTINDLHNAIYILWPYPWWPQYSFNMTLVSELISIESIFFVRTNLWFSKTHENNECNSCAFILQGSSVGPWRPVVSYTFLFEYNCLYAKDKMYLQVDLGYLDHIFWMIVGL